MTHPFFGAELAAIRAGMSTTSERKLREQMEAASNRAASFMAQVKSDAAEALGNYPWQLATSLIDVLSGFLYDVERDAASTLESFRAEMLPYPSDMGFHVDDFLVNLAISMRDARWELMAERAERRPAEELSKTMTVAEFAASSDRSE